MAIDSIGAGDLESKARKVFQDKILEELPQASRIALAKLINLKSTKIDWVEAYSIFSEYFPEILSDFEGMTLEQLIHNLYAYEDEELASGFEQWAEDNEQYYEYLSESSILGFDDVVQAISQCMYDYELHDTKEDCDADALKAARRIYR